MEGEATRYMKSERNRLETFRHWPPHACQDPRILAKAGFYYRGADDKVECPFCYGILVKWKPTDDPFFEHRSHFPHCKFITGELTGNVPLDEQGIFNVFHYDDNRINSNAAESRLGFTVERHVETEESDLLDFSKEANRLRTFSGWPRHLTQRPESLARAGFYHFPCDDKLDRVRCAYCRGKLFNWRIDDEPWTEHARCFPTCPYVKLCVGENAIENLMTERVESQRPKHNEDRALERNTQIYTPSTDVRNRGQDVTYLMESEAVQAVREMGFPLSLVRKAVERHSSTTPREDMSGESLTSLMFQIEREESGENATGGTEPQANNNVTKLRESVHNEHSKLHRKYKCSVCHTSEVRVTFLPCGHLVSCVTCSLSSDRCPACGGAVTGSVKTFY